MKRSNIALAILALLQESPMHPYRMQQLIRERGKDEVINVEQRASLYQTIQRLEREGLIHPQKTLRDEGRPERTVYEITPAGRATVLRWMREMLSKPAAEYPDFPAALSFLALLQPEDALRQLETRAVALEAELARIDQGLKAAAAVPRLFLLEIDYVRAVHLTELNWVTSVIEDLRAGGLTWSETWLRQLAAQFSPDPHSET